MEECLPNHKTEDLYNEKLTVRKYDGYNMSYWEARQRDEVWAILVKLSCLDFYFYFCLDCC